MTRRTLRGGFTVIELLTVIVILCLLGALAYPSLVSARAAANRARTKVLFGQWATAIEAFRDQYGCYPQFAASHLVNAGADSRLGGEHLFHDVLAGRRRDGSALPVGGDPASAGAQNPAATAFYTFSGQELGPDGLLRDGLGNTEIVVLVDSDLDGFVRAGADFGSLPAVHTADGSAIYPSAADFPAGGVRGGVIFYSADATATASAPAFVCSWK